MSAPELTVEQIDALAVEWGKRLNRIYRPGYEPHVEDYQTAASIITATLRAADPARYGHLAP